MPLYKYKAITYEGQSLDGTYEAGGKNEVIAMLRRNNYYPVSIEEITERKDISDVLFLGNIKVKELAIFCRQFYTMLGAGVPIAGCLEVLKTQSENRKFRDAISNVYDDIQKGIALSVSLKNHKEIFPNFLINMIETGELSGNLDSILERMSIYYEKEDKIISRVKGAMVYPIMLSTISVLIVVFLLVFIMPTFLNMFEEITLPIPTRVLFFIGGVLSDYWYICIAGLVLVILGFRQLYRSERGKLFFDNLRLKIFVVKGIVQKLIASKFTRTLSILLDSGVPLIQALESTARVCDNKVFESRMGQVIGEVSVGTPLADAVKKMNIFSPMVISMIKVGEQSGRLGEILDKTASFYDEEIENLLQKIITLLEPLMIIIMSIVIGAVVVAITLPMFDMVNMIPL